MEKYFNEAVVETRGQMIWNSSKAKIAMLFNGLHAKVDNECSGDKKALPGKRVTFCQGFLGITTLHKVFEGT